MRSSRWVPALGDGCATLRRLAGCLTLGMVARIAEAAEEPPGQSPPPAPPGGRVAVPADDARLRWAPWVWKPSGAGADARMEAAMPGAYVAAAFRDSTTVRVRVDGTAQRGCSPAALPMIDWSLDDGAFRSARLEPTDGVYALPLGEALDRASVHRLELHFRSACLGPERWKSSTVHLRLAGLELDSGGSLVASPGLPKRAIGFGDSITEGVCVEGLCPYYSDLALNNARATWFPLVCAALGCEYGQLGTGGQGMVRELELPPLGRTWDRYDASTSRLRDGRLDPEPDYVFCAMGTNDFQGEGDGRTLLPIADEYVRWLAAVRDACPRARIFCVVPPLGWHAEEIASAVSARNESGDRRVFRIDTAPVRSGFGVKGPTRFAPDGVHPSILGSAALGACVLVQVQRILDRDEGP